MKKFCFKFVVSAVLLISMLGLQSPIVSEANVNDYSLTIMHTNDTHANLDKVANRVTLVKQIRNTKPNNLLLDAGDVFSGTLYFNEFKGQADLEFMNLMEYDAMVFGNHEFDLGASEDGHLALQQFVSGAKFPLLGTNADFSKDPLFDGLQHTIYTANYNNGEIYNGIIKEIAGEKIGIFGLVTEETKDISSPVAITFSNYIDAAKEAVSTFEQEGINKIIAVTHIGFDDSADYDNDLLLAEAVKGIDVIVGGHTHKTLTEPRIIEHDNVPTVIVQAGEYNKFLGQLDLTFDENGVITSHNGILHKVSEAQADPAAAELLKPYADKIEETKNKSTGVHAEVILNGKRNEGGVRASETNLGNLITDGMLAKAKTVDRDTVIALQNGGGIRAGIDEGDITVGEVLTVMPFGNSLAIMNVKGSEIIAALEHSVKEYPAEFGGFLHVSGLSFNFDPKAPVGSRVLAAYLTDDENGKTLLEADTFYKVATNTFTAKGGDGYTMFGKAYEEGRVSEPGYVDYEMFIEYIQQFETVAPEMEGRINAHTPGWNDKVDSKPFYVDAHGNIVTGWANIDNEWYFLDDEGFLVTGWAFDHNKWYYLNKNGVMQTNWNKIGPIWYFFNDSSGAMQTGWLKDRNNWYLFSSTGAMQTGWQKSGHKWYFLNTNGAMRTGWVKSYNQWYFLNHTGAMQTGWVKVNGKWYYMDSSGAMKTGWVKVNSKWYYLHSDGHMAASTTIDGYKLNSSGAWIQ
ncbi:5'-nucleotidase C-terminal domain-containing protein [Sporosarcina saromensis]|uniref:5'-nucleotidase C-terminal domain-containing protein n=1 Tax=Sporosarcina saromensis TaxID=359365 RepID=A0ABU4GAL6_9BACL|nr:5'-nucleotidase C-terminal domain-containing protein [Sporosarcina saromensis]MDW0114024.1 5'-nucleotidase C-terminal domain-containing protein [Sporosarcina saromensis]